MRIYIDKDFPGGNIQINRIEGNTIYLEQEIRDTTEWWFYFSFRATAKVKGEYTFIFENGDVISRFGPAISLDGYNYFFNKETFINNHCFKYSFEENSTVYFAFSYPYQEKHFDIFISKHKDIIKEEMDELTNRGRKQYVYSFGNKDGKTFLLTCRHHACEASANYVLEGAIEQLLISPLKNKYSISVIPFVDLDGVIDGDQGKSRYPHDHNRDYIDEPIYSSIRYIKKHYHNNLIYYFDLHCPGKWGGIHNYVSLIEGDETMSERQEKYSTILEKNNCSSIPYQQINNIKYLAQWNKPSCNSRKFFVEEKAKLGFTLEIPFFGELDEPYSIEGLRNLGTSLIKSLELFEKE